MTLSRRRQPVSIIILIAAVYLAAFLLHDLTIHGALPLSADLTASLENCLGAQNSDGPDGGEAQARPAPDRHHCPFCNGFTGGVTVTMLPPPAENNSKPPRPLSRSHSGESRCTSFARAPPVA